MHTRRSPPSGPRGNGAGPAGPRRRGPADGLESLIGDLRADLRRVYDGLQRTGAVEWRRFQWRTVDVLSRAEIHVCLLAFALAGSISAALCIVRGIREALAGWSRAGWVGDLGAGIIMLVLLVGGGQALRILVRRVYLNRAKRDLAEPRPLGSAGP